MDRKSKPGIAIIEPLLRVFYAGRQAVIPKGNLASIAGSDDDSSNFRRRIAAPVRNKLRQSHQPAIPLCATSAHITLTGLADQARNKA